MQLEDGTFPSYYFVLLIIIFALHRVTLYAMLLGLLAYFTRISDPLVGGTFITLLMSFSNLGSLWSKSFSLWFVGQITLK